MTTQVVAQSAVMALQPEEKALLLMAQSCNKLLQQREKTNAVYVQTVNELQHVNTSQADELQQMKAAMEFEKEAYQREVAILKAQLAAERAKHDVDMRLENEDLEAACYYNVGSFTCCLSFDSFQAHLRADWNLCKDKMRYRQLLQFFLKELENAKGPNAQAANECLIEWFPHACSNLKTYEETRKRNL